MNQAAKVARPFLTPLVVLVAIMLPVHLAQVPHMSAEFTLFVEASKTMRRIDVLVAGPFTVNSKSSTCCCVA